MKEDSCTFEQFNEEFNTFHKHLKETKFSDQEIRKIFSPINKSLLRSYKIATLALIFLSIAILLYLLSYFETISWHLSAIARIFLIKLLPVWDWTPLKNEKCFFKKNDFPTPTNFNCDLCENIHQIDVYENLDEEILRKRYLDLDIPVIIKDDFENWSKPENLVRDILQDNAVSESTPCSLSNNVHNGFASVKKILKNTEFFDKFFVQFQNCEIQAMKHFRSFTPRPGFLPAELSPIQYNWLLWSRNYNATSYKLVNLVEKVTVIGQMSGGNFVRLVPRNNCEGFCPVVGVKLRKGEALIFTSLWNLEYRPDEVGENIAVILEAH